MAVTSRYEEALFRYRAGLISEEVWQRHLQDDVFRAWLNLRADWGMEPPEHSLTLAKIVELYLPDLAEDPGLTQQKDAEWQADHNRT